MYYIGIDVGGTTIKGGIVTESAEIIYRRIATSMTRQEI